LFAAGRAETAETLEKRIPVMLILRGGKSIGIIKGSGVVFKSG
jgi:hypothetical protein